jgi:uncharacterized protein YlbG (UPF0298 family)
MLKRISLIVYFRNPKALKRIEKVSDIKYFTKKKKYAIIYVTEEEKDDKIKQLKEIKLVRKIEESMLENDGYQIDFNVQ